MRNLDGSASATDWVDAVDRALFVPGAVRLAFQPIVDLQRATVAGYEVLARFDVPGLPSAPLPWLSAAAEQGRLAALEQTVLVQALKARHDLAPNVFLSVNLSAGVMLEATTAALFASAGDLRGLVVEITEHDRVLDYDALREAFAPTRAAGALLGVDDAGAGYASLGHVLALRPAFVKLDRALVADLDREHDRCAAVAAIGALAGELDGWLVAEGIERAGELDALVALDVPLGQGYFLGRPEYERAGVPPAVVAQLQSAPRRGRNDLPVRSLVRDVPMRAADAGWIGLREPASPLDPQAVLPGKAAELWDADPAPAQSTAPAGPWSAALRAAEPGGSWPAAPEAAAPRDSWPGALQDVGPRDSWPGTQEDVGPRDSWPGTQEDVGPRDSWPGAVEAAEPHGSWAAGADGAEARGSWPAAMEAAEPERAWSAAVEAAGPRDPWSAELAVAEPAPPVVVLTDAHGAPVGLELDGRPAAWGPRPMTVLAGESVAEVALRCASRPSDERLLPVICCDDRGRALGLVTVDALLHALAREQVQAARG